ncbi:MAG: hypothetical protein COA90_01475 [Gammaproteobacteria bacterium]|nr:MAG: hypothetical protein COA90_01475 [Gammaproteobacteria bacterium]
MDENVYKNPEASLENNRAFCRECGHQILITTVTCSKCRATQVTGGKEKVIAALLAIFLGNFGIHRFYLGQWWGVFYLLFFWTLIPGIISLIEGFVFLCTSQETWTRKYSRTKGSSALVLVLVLFFAVVPVLGILAAIAVPAYQQYKENAEQHQIEAKKKNMESEPQLQDFQP